MKDIELRKMLTEGGVIFQQGDQFVRNGCRDFNKLWEIAFENKRRLEMLLDHFGLEFTETPIIVKKEK